MRLDKIAGRRLFRCVVSNQVVEQQPDVKFNNQVENMDITRKSNGYRVTSLQCDEDSVKLKLKRRSFASPQEVKKSYTSPKVLLERINIQDSQKTNVEYKPENFEEKPQILLDRINVEDVQKTNFKSDDVECKPKISSKENKCVKESPAKTSRRKQSFGYKMYISDINSPIDIIKNVSEDLENKKNKETKRHLKNSVTNQDVDTIVDTMKSKLVVVTPQKSNKSTSTPQRRRLPRLQEETDDEPLRKTPKKSRVASDVDIITHNLKSKLGIVTPQKNVNQTTTPRRRRLIELEDGQDEPIKKIKEDKDDVLSKPLDSSSSETASKKSLSCKNNKRKDTSDENKTAVLKSLTKNDEDHSFVISLSDDSESESEDNLSPEFKPTRMSLRNISRSAKSAAENTKKSLRNIVQPAR